MKLNDLKKYFDIDTKKIDLFLDYLIEQNKKINLTSITSKEEMIEKHIFDSLLISKKINFANKLVLDVGSGGGFPGIPLAILYPNAKFILVDSTEKKIRYLNDLISYLKLENVIAISSRVESLNEIETYDIVISRAFADLPIYLELVTYLSKINGLIIALKGAKGNEELKSSENAIRKLNLSIYDIQYEELPTNKDKRINLIFKKLAKTSKKYPRNYSIIKNNKL